MKENSEIGNGVYAPEVLELVKAANDYCSWLEEAEKQPALQFIKSAIKHLSSVYLHTVSLKAAEPVMEGGNEKFVTEKDWSSVYQKVLNLLGRHNSYLRIADEGEYDRSDLVTHTISEDLADVYQDLKDFTLQYRQGLEEIMNDALWELQDNFDNYWSRKLLNSLQAINSLYIKKIDPGSEDPGEDQTDENDVDTPAYDQSFFTKLQQLNEEDDEDTPDNDQSFFNGLQQSDEEDD